MARGMVVGETPTSQANNEAFEEGYARIFGDRAPQRGHWFVDPKTGELRDTPPEIELGEQRVPVYSDLYMDGVTAPDGTDIGSKRKRRAYMAENGLCDSSDVPRSYTDGVRARQERKHEKSFRAEIERVAREQNNHRKGKR